MERDLDLLLFLLFLDRDLDLDFLRDSDRLPRDLLSLLRLLDLLLQIERKNNYRRVHLLGSV